MGFDEPNEEDTQLDLYGVAVVIAEEHQELLSDTVLDYVELQPGQFNFIFADSRLVESESASTPQAGGGCSSGGCPVAAAPARHERRRAAPSKLAPQPEGEGA